MIIVSITGPTFSEALHQIVISRKDADLFEFRLDRFRKMDLRMLIRLSRRPVIGTCRPVKEGGGFSGTNKARLEILHEVCSLGAGYVDLELYLGASEVDRFHSAFPGIRVIVSRHLRRPPSPLVCQRVFEKLQSTGADIIKLAYPARDSSDVKPAWDFLEKAHRSKQKAIAVAMGDAGQSSRVTYKIFGGWGTYASPDGSTTSAAGQLSAQTLRVVYRAERLNRRTRIFGVIGDPLVQSKGPMIHNPLFHKAGKNAVYCKFPVKDLKKFMKTVAPQLSGFSVTIPHKESIMNHLDSIDRTSASIGAVNTVYRVKGHLRGTNTDAAGALDAIEDVLSVKGKQILVIGAGGAAKAIAYEAKNRGAVVTISNRTMSQAKTLASELQVDDIPMERVGSMEYDILANATSAGMVPDTGVSVLPSGLVRSPVVFDVVYNPPLTKFLRDARRRGAKTIPGTAMYIYQAAKQSELYTGVKASIRYMKRLLANAMNSERSE